MRRTPNRPDRAGFTLVELLVVITIIAILFALTSAAVVKALGKGDEAKLRGEISQLAEAVQAFKTDFQVSYIPDMITLPPAADATGESSQYITSVWPRINPAVLANNATGNAYWGTGGSAKTLVGHQTLVFFLGGVKLASGTGYTSLGFSNSPSDPMNATTVGRKGPYFEFPPDRLYIVTSPYPSFKDVFGSLPYLYFSAKKSGNDYAVNPANNRVIGVTIGSVTVYPYQLSGTAPNVTPAANAPPRVWANKSSFQIISAGKNQVFNDGGLNWPGAGGSTSADGYYNVANFHPTLLGVAAQ